MKTQTVKRLAAIYLVISIFVGSSPTVGAALARDTVSRASGWLKAPPAARSQRSQDPGMPKFPPSPARQQPQSPPTKSQREARVFRIKLDVDREQWIASGQRFTIGAVPVDRDGNAIHGLRVEWSTSNKQVVFVSRDGKAIAGQAGSAHLTVRASNKHELIKINVFDDGPERKKAASDSHAKKSLALMAKARTKFAHASIPAPPDDRLPDSETESLYQPINKVGKPPGKTEALAAKSAVANGAVETPGSANYTFSLEIESLPGRQLDASLGLTYNSRVWHKVVSGSTTKVYFDVDYGWPAPGFRLGYGQIEYQGTAGYTLTEPDGTRRKMLSIGGDQFRTKDGSIITYQGSQYGGTVTFPDGTHVYYSATNGPRSYPTAAIDRQGNYIQISYVNNQGPKISSIVDTLGRYFLFYYSGNDLIAITAPGYDNSTTDRQVIRFYYETIEFLPYSLFHANYVQINCPSSTRVLRYVFMPGTQNGYRYDYSPYGIIRVTSELRGMTVDTTSLTAMGWPTSDGQVAATSEYDYTIYMQNLVDVPKYTTRTDDWAGRTPASPPVWTFSADEENGITTVTSPSPDNTVIESQSNPEDGQLQSVTIKYQGAVLAKVSYVWILTAVGPRLQKVETTNDANQTCATTFDYDSLTIFNNVSVVSERDFAAPGTLGTELRRTEVTYENSTNYTNRGLIHLPKSVKEFVGNSSTPSSHTVYNYDESTLTDRPGIIMYDPSYNPHSEPQEWCGYQWNGWEDEWVCNYYPVYDPATAYRGNLTSEISYADAANTAEPQTNTLSYDIAGNITEQTVNCCRRKTYAYSSDYYFAYTTSESRGESGQFTSDVTFDFNTGLPRTATDENDQTLTIHYFPESLRYHMTVFPDSGYAAIDYNDALFPDPDSAHMHSLTMTTVSTGTGTVIHSYDFYDGRGAVVRHFNHFTAADGGNATTDVEYDALGRVQRTSNPYYSTNGTLSPINPEGFWTTNTFDRLGRLTQVTMPRGDDDNQLTTSVQTIYAGTITTIVDQAGKQRRRKVDALDRVIRVDEPDASGNLGDVEAPLQATSYEYDTLDNLIHITQGAQQRYFRYDSLSRITHERQVEQDAPWTTSDYVAGNNQWSRKIIYNSQGLIQDAYDARQMRTQFVYDSLNRVKEIHYFAANGSPDPSTPDAYYWYDSQTLPGGVSFDRGYSTGRVVAMTYGSANSATGNYLGYDEMGRVLRHRQITGAASYNTSYTYSLAGQLLSETYPSNRALNYAYDEAGRLSQVSEGATIYANGFAYQPHGGLSSETLGNGMVHSLAYNRRLQASEVKLKQSVNGAELQRYNYSYGQVTQADGAIDTTKNNGQIGRIDGYIDGAKQWDQRMLYDSLGRLSTAAEYRGDNGGQSWQVHYDHDRYGNRFQYQANSNVAYTPVQTNEIQPERNRFLETGATPTEYDPAGNTLTDTKFRGLKYQYDANGRQIAAKLLNNTNIQNSVYDCAGQRVQTIAGSVTRTMVYDVFGQNIANYTGSNGATLERQNIYRGGQLLATETPASTAPSALDAAPTSSNIALSWTAAGGSSNYRVERKAAGGSFGLLTTTTSTSTTDGGASSGSAYLYRVCAADGSGNCTSGYSNVTLGAPVNFPTDPAITSIADDPTGVNVTTMKVGHITELRTAVNAVRSLAGLSAATWTHTTLTAQVSEISKDDVVDLRVKLNEALGVLGIQTSAYTDDTLAGAPNGTLIKAAHIRELRQRATSGTGIGGGGSSGGFQYVLFDLQASARAVMNNSGVGTSTVIARHDYLPFGEEIGSGTGMRTSGQGYGAVDTNRWKYGMLERDSVTGLDHALWRKYDNTAGRWTSPDPLSSAAPQGLNGYSYAGNDPVNLIDPAGLMPCEAGDYGAWCGGGGYWGPADLNARGIWGDDPRPGYREIYHDEMRLWPLQLVGDGFKVNYHFQSLFDGWDWPWGGYELQDPGAPGPINPKNDPCADLYKEIARWIEGLKGVSKGVKQRFREQINGRGPGTRTWANHDKEIQKAQQKAKDNIERYDDNDCNDRQKLPRGWRSWAYKPRPTAKDWAKAHQPIPAPQSSYSIPWREVGKGAAIGLGVVIVIQIIIILVGGGAVVFAF